MSSPGEPLGQIAEGPPCADWESLARDPAARPFLQSGSNVILSYQGQVVDSGCQALAALDSPAPGHASAAMGPHVPVVRWAVLGLALLIGLLAAAIVGGVVVVAIYRSQRDRSPAAR